MDDIEIILQSIDVNIVGSKYYTLLYCYTNNLLTPALCNVLNYNCTMLCTMGGGNHDFAKSRNYWNKQLTTDYTFNTP